MSGVAAPPSRVQLDSDLPAAAPRENDLSRALFQDRDCRALEVVREDTRLYLLPCGARHGGVAGFAEDLETHAPRPVELTAHETRRLLEERTPREVSLTETPVWILDDRERRPRVSWHARVRWAERVEAMADPASTIRHAFENGLQVGVPRGYGRYYPPDDVVVCYVGRTADAPDTITTIYTVDDVRAADDLGSSHLAECPACETLLDPGKSHTCPWCGNVCRLPRRIESEAGA